MDEAKRRVTLTNRAWASPTQIGVCRDAFTRAADGRDFGEDRLASCASARFVVVV